MQRGASRCVGFWKHHASSSVALWHGVGHGNLSKGRHNKSTGFRLWRILAYSCSSFKIPLYPNLLRTLPMPSEWKRVKVEQIRILWGYILDTNAPGLSWATCSLQQLKKKTLGQDSVVIGCCCKKSKKLFTGWPSGSAWKTSEEAPVWLGEFGTNGYWTTAVWWMEVGEVLWLRHLLRYMNLGLARMVVLL